MVTCLSLGHQSRAKQSNSIHSIRVGSYGLWLQFWPPHKNWPVDSLQALTSQESCTSHFLRAGGTLMAGETDSHLLSHRMWKVLVWESVPRSLLFDNFTHVERLSWEALGLLCRAWRGHKWKQRVENYRKTALFQIITGQDFPRHAVVGQNGLPLRWKVQLQSGYSISGCSGSNAQTRGWSDNCGIPTLEWWSQLWGVLQVICYNHKTLPCVIYCLDSGLSLWHHSYLLVLLHIFLTKKKKKERLHIVGSCSWEHSPPPECL